jgi:hypothetical protein
MAEEVKGVEAEEKAEEEVSSSNPIELDLPMYALINDLPVCAKEDGDNVVMEEYDPGSRTLKPSYRLSTLLHQADEDGPVDVKLLPEGEWTARVKELQNKKPTGAKEDGDNVDE